METYLDHAAALRFIAECEQNAVLILGMDFLIKDQESITPVGGTAWDLITVADESWREARLLLKDGIPDGGNVVVFVTEGR
jgi:hypothetical protein